jgi:hypothetical protein
MNTAMIKPRWSFITIVLMVFGFILWWPLGLAMLAYIIWGESFGGSSEKAENWVNEKKAWAKKHRRQHHSRGAHRASGNAAFDEYRDEQLKRLEEERTRLDEEIRNFSDYMQNLHKARDREEFDHYMNSRKNNPAGADFSTDAKGKTKSIKK